MKRNETNSANSNPKKLGLHAAKNWIFGFENSGLPSFSGSVKPGLQTITVTYSQTLCEVLLAIATCCLEPRMVLSAKLHRNRPLQFPSGQVEDYANIHWQTDTGLDRITVNKLYLALPASKSVVLLLSEPLTSPTNTCLVHYVSNTYTGSHSIHTILTNDAWHDDHCWSKFWWYAARLI